MSLDCFPLFDCHLHIIDNQFPLIENNGYLPPEFTCEKYLKRMSAYNLCGGVIVSGSFQGFDQDYLVEALKALGDQYVGVTQLPISVSDEEIMRLHEHGVRAVRFNLKRGGSEGVDNLTSMAQRVFDLVGWHVELYVDSDQLEDLYKTLISLPAVSIDHLGLKKSGFDQLLRLVDKGVHVKATGYSRVDFDVAEGLKSIYSVNPEALMFGSDLPSTRAPKVYSDQDFLLTLDVLGEDAARKVFCENAIKFYKPKLNGD